MGIVIRSASLRVTVEVYLSSISILLMNDQKQISGQAMAGPSLMNLVVEINFQNTILTISMFVNV